MCRRFSKDEAGFAGSPHLRHDGGKPSAGPGPQIMSMSLGPIAAGLHRAPAPAAILAVVEKQPQALVVRAMAQAKGVGTDHQVSPRPQNRGEQGGSGEPDSVDLPTETLVAARQHPASGSRF